MEISWYPFVLAACYSVVELRDGCGARLRDAWSPSVRRGSRLSRYDHRFQINSAELLIA
jgi:hypothetical protein